MQIKGFMQARPADLERLYPVELNAFPEQAWPKDAFQSALSDPGSEFQMAVDGADRPLGYVLLNYARAGSDTACVDSLAVSTEARGQKLGEQLLLLGIDKAVARGANTLLLEVEKGNAPAESLYAKYGFVPTRTLVGYYQGNDGHEMQLQNLQSPEVLSELAKRRQQLAEKLGKMPSQLFVTKG